MDDQQFRNVMAASPAPVTIVTTMDEELPFGCTVSAFMSVSVAPRMVTVALDRRSSVLARVEKTKILGINVLAAAQSDLAMQFASSLPNRFAGVAWWREGGLPRLLGATAWLRCRLANIVDAGDHRLLVAEVIAVAHSHEPPMVYAERLFGGHSLIQKRPVLSIARQMAACTR